METERWYVVATVYVRGAAVQQLRLEPSRVSELKHGKWGCEMYYSAPGD